MHNVFLALLCAVVLVGCSAETAGAPTPAIPVLPTLAPSDAPAIPARSPISIERVPIAETANHAATEAIVARLDPAQHRLRVQYTPDSPRSLGTWAQQLQPLLVVNGAFFTPENRSTALVIADGVASGQSYEGFGGMVSIDSAGRLDIRSLRDAPYDAAESLQQAMQSFPMLVFPGNQPAALEEDGRRSRRTALAIDTNGTLLVIVIPGSALTLNEFAQWLSSSSLQIDRALNLDGGGSTGLYVAGSDAVLVDSFDALPLVLVVEAG